MSENIIYEMKCPSCGAQVYFTEEGQEYAYCSHCGTQVFKEDTHFDKRVELEKHKLDTSKDIAIEQMKHEEADKNIESKQMIIACVFTVAVFFVVATLGFLGII